MISHVQIVQVPTSDQEAAREFYVDRLGLEVIADVEIGPHGRWLQVAPSGAATSLVPGDEDSTPGQVGALVFETDDIDGAVEALTDRGVTFADGMRTCPGGGSHASLTRTATRSCCRPRRAMADAAPAVRTQGLQVRFGGHGAGRPRPHCTCRRRHGAAAPRWPLSRCENCSRAPQSWCVAPKP